MKSKLILTIVVLILILLTSFGIYKMTGNSVKEVEDSNNVLIKTNYGDITIELYPKKAPITVENFKNYVNEDFYSETTFHRIIEGFMIQ